MSFFHEAHDVVVNGGAFVNNQTTIVNGQSGIDILLEASTPEAAVDAEERSYAPSCYPDTRVQYIEDITTWATTNNGNDLPIYWMRGPAGVGKSAIAQTCAQKVKKSGYLGAAFFFSINGRRNDHTRFFLTLAYQLSTTLLDYRESVNRRVLNDKTIVAKTMKAQFEGLIVEPLLELKEQGKEVQMKSIFIDGLDECESRDAQVEIIKIIASSVHTSSTPFRWAIFSRPEPCIISTFKLSDISPHCRHVYLPISRDSNKEIAVYLRGGFDNILRRRDMVLSSPWPTDEDLEKLVKAAAGLFAYCATVLRFIDTYSFSGFKETLQLVLKAIAQPHSHPAPLFADLDELYILILQRVPKDILSPMLLFLHMIIKGVGGKVTLYCHSLGISEATFKSICYHLQAVMIYRKPQHPLQTLDPNVDFTRSYWDQGSSFNDNTSLVDEIRRIYGTVSFHHKSFKDFLSNPDRSTTFYIDTEAMQGKFVDCLAQQRLHYESTYIIQGSKLILAPRIISSSASLSWPHGTEIVDSYLKLRAFRLVSDIFILNLPAIDASIAKALSPFVVQTLTKLNHRMSLVGQRMYYGLSLRRSPNVLFCPGYVRQIDGTIFRCIQPDDYHKFDLTEFLATIKQLEKFGIFEAFHPHIPSTLASIRNSYSRTRRDKHYALYKWGHDEKSVVWYWEIDTKEWYYHDFWTVDYAEAMRIYKKDKSKIWEDSWVPPSSNSALDP